MEKALRDLGYHDKELSILLTDDDRIAELNRHYLKRNGPTNVISFPMMETGQTDRNENPQDIAFCSDMLGDIVVSVDTAAREAAEAGESLQYTLERLLVHGLLHLAGFDHERSLEDEEIMTKEENRLLRLINS